MKKEDWKFFGAFIGLAICLGIFAFVLGHLQKKSSKSETLKVQPQVSKIDCRQPLRITGTSLSSELAKYVNTCDAQGYSYYLVEAKKERGD